MPYIKLEFLVIAFVGCCLCSQTLSAQDYREGYIITNSGDSISGFVSYSAGNKNLARCTFKKTRKSKAARYSASELKAYGVFGDKQYISLTLPDNSFSDGSVFVRVIASGPISLYRYGRVYFIKKDSMLTLPIPERKLIETERGPMSKEDKRYVGVLNSVLLDCGLTADESTYAESDLTNLINNYNRCKGYEPMRKKPRPLAKINYELFSGFVQSNLKLNDIYENITFAPSNTIIGGFGIDYSSPRIFDRLFFSVEGWYAKTFYQAYIEGPFSGDFRRRDILIDNSNFKVPLGFRYNFLRESSTPYIKAGVLLTIYQRVEIKTLDERETSAGDVYTTEYYGGYYLKKPAGIWFSAGYDKMIVGRAKLFVEFRYEKVDGFIGGAINSFSSMANYNLLLGIRY